MSSDTDTELQVAYRFKVVNLLDRDASVLVCVRYFYESRIYYTEEGRHEFKAVDHAEILTHTGWENYFEHSTYPMDRLPSINGLEMHNQHMLLQTLDHYEQHIRNAIKADTGIECH